MIDFIFSQLIHDKFDFNFQKKKKKCFNANSFKFFFYFQVVECKLDKGWIVCFPKEIMVKFKRSKKSENLRPYYTTARQIKTIVSIEIKNKNHMPTSYKKNYQGCSRSFRRVSISITPHFLKRATDTPKIYKKFKRRTLKL